MHTIRFKLRYRNETEYAANIDGAFYRVVLIDDGSAYVATQDYGRLPADDPRVGAVVEAVRQWRADEDERGMEWLRAKGYV